MLIINFILFNLYNVNKREYHFIEKYEIKYRRNIVKDIQIQVVSV